MSIRKVNTYSGLIAGAVFSPKCSTSSFLPHSVILAPKKGHTVQCIQGLYWHLVYLSVYLIEPKATQFVAVTLSFKQTYSLLTKKSKKLYETI